MNMRIVTVVQRWTLRNEFPMAGKLIQTKKGWRKGAIKGQRRPKRKHVCDWVPCLG